MEHRLSRNYWTDYAALTARQATPRILRAMREDFISALGRQLLPRISDLCPPTGGAIAACLLERMCDPSLFYHTPLHILSIFAFADAQGIELSDWERLCIWFHDAIYRPGARTGENERNSAVFARSLLRGHLPARMLAQVEACIDATAHHEALKASPRFALVLDLDLCNFAWDQAAHDAAGRQVARELTPVYGGERYAAGRRRFLSGLLARRSLYRTKLFRERYEAAARANIERTLND